MRGRESCIMAVRAEHEGSVSGIGLADKLRDLGRPHAHLNADSVEVPTKPEARVLVMTGRRC